MKVTKRAADQACDDQDGPLAAAEIEGAGKLRPVGLAAALHFHELAGQLTPAAQEGGDGGALRVEAKAALPLAVGETR